MPRLSGFRTALLALAALVGLSSAALADSGTVTLTIYKGGWVIGASGGGGTLTFHGRRYPLSVGGLDYGLVFGGSKTILQGRVHHITRPSDVAGVYGAAGAGLAIGGGARAIVLTNQKGAVLELAGQRALDARVAERAHAVGDIEQHTAFAGGADLGQDAAVVAERGVGCGAVAVGEDIARPEHRDDFGVARRRSTDMCHQRQARLLRRL